MEKDNSKFYDLWDELDSIIDELANLHGHMAGGSHDLKALQRQIATRRLRKLAIVKALEGMKAPVSKP